MIKVKKHKTCVGCFAHCISFPGNFYHTGGTAFCTLHYPVKSAVVKHEQAYDHEAIPVNKCPKPLSYKKFCEAIAPMALLKTS